MTPATSEGELTRLPASSDGPRVAPRGRQLLTRPCAMAPQQLAGRLVLWDACVRVQVGVSGAHEISAPLSLLPP